MSLGSTRRDARPVIGCMVCEDPNSNAWETWRPHQEVDRRCTATKGYPGTSYWMARKTHPRWGGTAGWLCREHLQELRIKDLLEQLREGFETQYPEKMYE